MPTYQKEDFRQTATSLVYIMLLTLVPSILLAYFSNIVPSPHIWMAGEWSDADECERKKNARKTKDKTGGCVQEMIRNTIGHMTRDRRD